MELPGSERARHLDTGISGSNTSSAWGRSLQRQPCSVFPPQASVSGSRIPSAGRASGPRANPAPRGPRSLTPSGTLRLPRRPRAGGRAGGAAFCALRYEVPETPQPRAGSPRGPPAPPPGVPAPLLGSSCQLGARWFAPRGARGRGEAQSPLPRSAPEPASRGDGRRPSCGPDCS